MAGKNLGGGVWIGKVGIGGGCLCGGSGGSGGSCVWTVNDRRSGLLAVAVRATHAQPEHFDWSITQQEATAVSVRCGLVPSGNNLFFIQLSLLPAFLLFYYYYYFCFCCAPYCVPSHRAVDNSCFAESGRSLQGLVTKMEAED